MVELRFGNVSFCVGRKTGEPGEKPTDRGENQQQTQPTYDTGPELNSELLSPDYFCQVLLLLQKEILQAKNFH